MRRNSKNTFPSFASEDGRAVQETLVSLSRLLLMATLTRLAVGSPDADEDDLFPKDGLAPFAVALFVTIGVGVGVGVEERTLDSCLETGLEDTCALLLSSLPTNLSLDVLLLGVC